jgi:hypothetical protein
VTKFYEVLDFINFNCENKCCRRDGKTEKEYKNVQQDAKIQYSIISWCSYCLRKCVRLFEKWLGGMGTQTCYWPIFRYVGIPVGCILIAPFFHLYACNKLKTAGWIFINLLRVKFGKICWHIPGLLKIEQKEWLTKLHKLEWMFKIVTLWLVWPSEHTGKLSNAEFHVFRLVVMKSSAGIYCHVAHWNSASISEECVASVMAYS